MRCLFSRAYTAPRSAACGVLVMLAACAPRTPQTARPLPSTTVGAPLLLDGQFADWEGVPVWTRASEATRSPGLPATPAPVVLQESWLTDDPTWWHLSFTVRDSVTVSSMPGTLHLLIDADDDSTTGGRVFDLAGVDAAVDFSRMDKRQPNGYGAGAALRTVGDRALLTYRSSYELQVTALPTWSATRFEVRMARKGASDGFGRLGRAVRAQWVFEALDGSTSRLPAARYAFASSPSATMPDNRVSRVPGKAKDAVRVAHWNVSEGSFRSPARHAKLLAAVQPDIIMLDEAHRETDDASLKDFFALPELAALGPWSFVYSRSGGRQKSVVATRGRAIRQAASMVRVVYAPGALDSLRQLVPEAFHHAIDGEATEQISSTGAWIPVDGIETLFVPLDLQSGGFHNSPQDALRLLQGRTIRDHIARELGSRATRTAVVIGGDFNPVGSYGPVAALQRGLAMSGGDLTLGEAQQLSDRTRLTWLSVKGAQFAPGCLDLTLYDSTVLERVGGFVFSSEDLTPAAAAVFGLTTESSPLTSDHLIVVTDFRRRR